MIRTVFQTALPNTTSDPLRPLVILAVDDEDDLEALFPMLWGRSGRIPAGLYRSGPLRHHIAVRTDISGRERYQVVYHEYFHLLTSLTSGNLPPWLMEGLAEVYSNTVIRGTTAQIGDQRRDYLNFLLSQRLLPLESLVAEEVNPHGGDAYDTTLFYAQSWALTHYLLLGDETGAGQQKVFAYIEDVRAGKEPREAFVAVFGDFDDVGRELSRYVRREGFYGMRLDAPPTIREDVLGLRRLSIDEALSIQAGVLVQGTQPQRARPLLEQALSIAPRSAIAHEMLGLLYFQLDEPEDAVLAFEDAIAFGSESYVPYYLAAVLRTHTGRSDAIAGIEGLLRRAIELNPLFAPAYALLAGLVGADPSGSGEAIELAERAARLEPTDVQHWVAWGEVLVANNQMDEARTVAEEGLNWVHSAEDRQRLSALVTGTHDAHAVVERANDRRVRGQLEDALETYETAIRLDPRHAPAHHGRGLTLAAIGRLEDAVEAYRVALEIDPDSADAYNDLGEALARLESLDDAVGAFRRALDRDPTHATAARNLGLALSRLGRLDEAQVAIERAVEIEENIPRSRR